MDTTTPTTTPHQDGPNRAGATLHTVHDRTAIAQPHGFVIAVECGVTGRPALARLDRWGTGMDFSGACAACRGVVKASVLPNGRVSDGMPRMESFLEQARIRQTAERTGWVRVAR